MEKLSILKNLGLFIALTFVMASCDPEEVTPKGEYASGVFVANQGQFPNGAGSVTFFDRDSLLAKQRIFEAVNGRQLGSVVQSITIHEGRAYIIVNNANRIEVADAETFEQIAVINDVVSPRYFVGIDETKGYLSGWGAQGIAGYVKVIDLVSYTVTKEISTGSGTEKMLKLGSSVYAVNSGGFGTDSTAIIIDTETDEITKTIDLGTKNPKSLQLDGSDNLWILSVGYSDWSIPSNSINGKMVKINTITNEVETSFDLGGTDATHLVINKTGDRLFFNFLGSVYSQSTSNDTFDNNVVISKYFYGLGYDRTTSYLYGADAGDFTSDGQIFRYEENGTVVDSFATGVVPGGFTFME